MLSRCRSALLAISAIALTAAAPAPAMSRATAPAAARADGSPVDEGDVAKVIAKFKEKDPGMAQVFADAYGYAVFPSVGKGAIGIGGARGKGWVYEAGKLIGRSTLTQVSIGFQLGGQAYSEVVFFKNKGALDGFRTGHLKLDAQASAVALKARASGDLPWRSGIAIVTMSKGGLMYEASVGGQKFSFTPVGDTGDADK
ncbi:MAG TPA: YSC84-related protein [Gemmatimonadales bacterium]|nr:YSC84-related protein [Gemmatimonadales bacterium]